MLCIPVALGVPGHWDTAPQWWVPGDVFQKQLDDPRWNNAVNRSYNNGVGREAAFRGVYMTENNKPHLYFTFQLYTDPTASQQFDMVYLGLQRQNGTPYIVRIWSPSDTSNHDGDDTGGVEWLKLKTDRTVEQVPGTNFPDLKDRHWLKSAANSNTYVWAINVRVPVTSSGGDITTDGVNLGNIAGGTTFRMWYAIVYSPAPDDPNDPANGIGIPYYWPRTARIDDSGFDTLYPAATDWEEVKLGTGNCGAGVSLDAADIGVETAPNAPLSNYINASTAQPTTNKIAVRPKNNGITAGVPAYGLEAIVRIANWGSQTPWQQTGAGGWQVIPFGSTAMNQNTVGIADGLKGSITFEWTLSTSDAQQFVGQGAPRSAHQCLFAQLKSHANPPVDFINDSGYTNMWFIKTGSPVRERAEISVKGRQPAPRGASRKVYIFVERTNMPASLAEGEEAPRGWSSDERMLRTHVEDVELTVDALAQRAPTVRYHVFYSTGKKLRVPGRALTLYEPQTAFGYFVDHDGPLYGWAHALQPAPAPSLFAAAPATPEALKEDDQYVLEVPDNGAVSIYAVVAPVEEPGVDPIPPPPPPEPWWVQLLRALIGLIRKLLRR